MNPKSDLTIDFPWKVLICKIIIESRKKTKFQGKKVKNKQKNCFDLENIAYHDEDKS